MDFSVSLSDALQLPGSGRKVFQVVQLELSDRIANIYDGKPYYNWDNRKFAVSTNLVPPVAFILRRGLYGMVEDIAAAINDDINTSLGWWLDPTKPGLAMTACTQTDTVIVTIDPTKLNPIYGTTFNLDFRRSTTGTDIAETLGFSQATALLTASGLLPIKYFSNEEVQLDTQGTKALICSTLVDGRRTNNTKSRILAVVDFAGKNTISDNVWPNGGVISPVMLFGSETIRDYRIWVTTYNGYPMLFMNGGISGSIIFGDIGRNGLPEL